MDFLKKEIQCHYAEPYPSALPSVSLVVFVFSVIIALKCISNPKRENTGRFLFHSDLSIEVGEVSVCHRGPPVGPGHLPV